MVDLVGERVKRACRPSRLEVCHKPHGCSIRCRWKPSAQPRHPPLRSAGRAVDDLTASVDKPAPSVDRAWTGQTTTSSGTPPTPTTTSCVLGLTTAADARKFQGVACSNRDAQPPPCRPPPPVCERPPGRPRPKRR